jgi:hypothetical protein
VQSTNAVDDTTTVRVCFSKPIASLPQAGLFRMGDYNSAGAAGAELVATSATRSTSNCADAVFPNDDATQFTYISVGGSDGTAPDSGSSAVSTNGFGNIQDSTALIGSKTNNGTRGFGTAPDLVGISVNNAASTIDFTYDQRVRAVDPAAAAFQYNTDLGTSFSSLAGAANRAISSDGLTVRVNFPPGNIDDAVRAFSNQGAVTAKAGAGGQASSPLRSAARPGSGGFTNAPDLVAVTQAPDGSSLDYQFDQVLTAIPNPGRFFVSYSFGFGNVPGGAASIVGGAGVGNTVRVLTDAVIQNNDEFFTTGWVTAGAVTGAGGPNTAGGLPTGGNIGAFATGFTTGPEALTVTFDNATDIARVLMDQRWTFDDETRVKLLDDQGSQIAAGAINITGGAAPAAGRVTAEITFPAGTLAGARSLLLQTDAFHKDNTDSFSRVQVISPTAPAAKQARKFRRAPVLRRAAKRR